MFKGRRRDVSVGTNCCNPNVNVRAALRAHKKRIPSSVWMIDPADSVVVEAFGVGA